MLADSRPCRPVRRRASLLMIGASLAIAGCAGRPNATSSSTRPEPAPVRAETLIDAVATARPGDTIALPAGTFEGGITLPPGVSLHGAGPFRTILDARKVEVGLAIEGGRGAEVADLAIRGASKTDLLVHGAAEAAVRRVRTSESLNGINFADVTRGRIENVISDGNRYGIVVSGGRDNVVVNCTLARNASLGLSLPSGARTLAFNNCIAEGATGVYLGASAEGVRLDHNLYFTPFVGKMAGQLGRKSIGAWRYVSGQDARSVQFPVAFRDPSRDDFRPAGALEWALDRAPTSDWGAAELAGIEAPATDIEGTPRVDRYDVGAYERTLTPPRPADGRLTVGTDGVLTSAGLFAPGGREVAYLFHNLPLPHGSYSFWSPARDFQGRPIPAGTYELKTAQSALVWEYVHWVGDTGDASPPSRTAGVRPYLVAFDGEGRLIMGQGRSEDATNLRGYDAATGRWLWAFGGSSDLLGLAPGGDGAIYLLKPSGTKGLITRIDPKSGKIAPWPGRSSGTALFDGGSRASGLAELDGQLYVTDAQADAIRFGPTERPDFSRSVSLPAPTSPSADPSTHRLWLLGAGRRVVALDASGEIVADSMPVEAPAALAARAGRLAIASRATGKVHLFDAHDPERLTPLMTVGTGDGPFGPYRPDRFHFQAGPGDPGSHVNLALGPKGELAVVEENRLLVFDPSGTPLWSTFGEPGNMTALSFADPRRLFDDEGRKSLRLDEGAGTWAPDAYWDAPHGADFLGTFADGGSTFGAYVSAPAGQVIGSLLIVRYQGSSAKPVLHVLRDEGTGRYLARKDANHDGRLDDRDGGIVLPPPRGPHPLRGGGPLHRHYSLLQPGGDIITLNLNPDTWGAVWRRAGLDGDGVPVYRLQDCRAIVRRAGGFVSPYTGQPDETSGLAAATPAQDGGFLALANLRSAPGGTGLLNGAGTDAIGLEADGRLRWLHPLGQHKGMEGLATVGPVTITGVGTTAEIIALNRDGLGLGSFGFRAEAHYPGFFLDGPQAVRAYRGRDGRTYALIADTGGGMQHWWRLRGEDRIVTHSTPVTLSEPTAEALAALPARADPAPAKPAPPIVRIPRLARPLAIDGDPSKWRQAGIVPQVIITPETATGAIDGPRDAGAVVRLAYRDHDLYLQFLTFDDAPAFHQPMARHPLQDGVEFSINGFMSGFKFDVTQTADAGPIVFRSRFSQTDLDLLVPPEHAPRVIKVLDDARAVPERGLIESVYGVDMADCRAIVTELKLPIDERTYKDSTKDLFPFESGKAFRLGFQINDNDDPGTDVRNFLVWPATYGHFNPVEDAAIAVLE
jgi:Right handed beta helix region